MKQKVAALLLLISLSVIAAAAPPALAQSGYPSRADTHVNDFANVLTAEDEAQLRNTLQSLQSERGIEGVVVTVDAIADYGAADDVESFATNLFNRWAIDDRETNDGFLILVAVRDRRVRIELGRAYGRRYDDAMQGVIDEDMLPAFRDGAYASGILAGTDATIAALTDSAGGGLWDRFRNSRLAQVALALLALGTITLRRVRYFFSIGCLSALWQFGTAALAGIILGGFAGALWGMAGGDASGVEQTMMAMLTILEDGRFLQEFSLFSPSTLTGAGLGGVVTVALRFIGAGGDYGDDGGGGSSGGGGASGSW